MVLPMDTRALVLVVDDDVRTHRLIKYYLEPHGYHLAFAENGEAGLAQCEKLRPDIILLDILMPTLDGFGVCEALKKNPLTRDIPVLFLSAVQNIEDKVKAFAVGGVDYMLKPVAHEELLARLATHLGLLSAQRQLARHNALLQEKIRQHQAAERARQESQVLFEAVFNNTAMCVGLLDISGNYLKVNHKCLELLGYSEREMLHINCAQLTHPDDLIATRAAMEQLKRGDKPWCYFDKQLIRKDKSLLWTGYWLAPLFDKDGGCSAFICMISDLSARKQAELMLHKLSRAVEQSHNSIIITDLNGTIEFVNPAFCASTGYQAAEIIGQNPRLFKSGRQSPAFYHKLWQTLKTGHAWRGTFINRRKDGQLFHELATISPLKDARGVITHYVAVKEDITQLKNTQQALEQAIASAEQARHAAESANRIKSRFLVTMSHEIRTPMNSIIGFSEMLEAQTMDAQQREYLHIIRHSGRALLSLIDDILDLSRVEAGKLKLDDTPVDIAAILRDVPRLFTPKLHEKKLALSVDIAPDLPALVLLDAQRLRQILLNLLSNAIKFTEQGGIKISAWYEGADRNGVNLGFAVADSGSGMSTLQCATVFDAFEQQNTAREDGSTGLGLTITKRLVELMGGAITLDSTLGQGSIFRVRFRGLHVPLLKQTHFDTAMLRFSPAKLLFLSPHRKDQENLVACLSCYGLGVEAVSTFADLQTCLDKNGITLILMDFTPDKAESAYLRTVDIPVLRVGLEPPPDNKDAARRYFPKPVDMITLLTCLKTFLPYEQNENTCPDCALPPLPPSLAQHLREEFAPRWQALNQSSSFNTLEVLGRDIEALAARHAYLPLQVWGQRLSVQAAGFDVEHVFKTLAEFALFISME
jgi:PAS domain S-box-containing protein